MGTSPSESVALPRLRIRRRRPLSPWGRVCLAMAVQAWACALLCFVRLVTGEWLIGVKSGFLSDSDLGWTALLTVVMVVYGRVWWRDYCKERDREDMP